MFDYFKRIISETNIYCVEQNEYKGMDVLPRDIINMYKNKVYDFYYKACEYNSDDVQLMVAHTYPGPHYICYYQKRSTNKYYLFYDFSYSKSNVNKKKNVLISNGISSIVSEVMLDSEIPFLGDKLQKPVSSYIIDW